VVDGATTREEAGVLRRPGDLLADRLHAMGARASRTPPAGVDTVDMAVHVRSKSC
jgi:hypothetical protein